MTDDAAQPVPEPQTDEMLLIRRSEERLAAGYAAGKVPGALHLYIGWR
jgi:TPP-dependent pyruvate/acetoin dehydrogenase alpha subunit